MRYSSINSVSKTCKSTKPTTSSTLWEKMVKKFTPKTLSSPLALFCAAWFMSGKLSTLLEDIWGTVLILSHHPLVLLILWNGLSSISSDVRQELRHVLADQALTFPSLKLNPLILSFSHSALCTSGKTSSLQTSYWTVTWLTQIKKRTKLSNKTVTNCQRSKEMRVKVKAQDTVQQLRRNILLNK